MQSPTRRWLFSGENPSLGSSAQPKDQAIKLPLPPRRPRNSRVSSGGSSAEPSRVCRRSHAASTDRSCYAMRLHSSSGFRIDRPVYSQVLDSSVEVVDGESSVVFRLRYRRCLSYDTYRGLIIDLRSIRRFTLRSVAAMTVVRCRTPANATAARDQPIITRTSSSSRGSTC